MKNKTNYLPMNLVNVSVTAKALEALARAEQPVEDFLERHKNGDWGNLCDDDKAVYDRALKSGSTVISEFVTGGFDRLWIYTAIGSYTKVFLAEEY